MKINCVVLMPRIAASFLSARRQATGPAKRAAATMELPEIGTPSHSMAYTSERR